MCLGGKHLFKKMLDHARRKMNLIVFGYFYVEDKYSNMDEVYVSQSFTRG